MYYVSIILVHIYLERLTTTVTCKSWLSLVPRRSHTRTRRPGDEAKAGYTVHMLPSIANIMHIQNVVEYNKVSTKIKKV